MAFYRPGDKSRGMKRNPDPLYDPGPDLVALATDRKRGSDTIPDSYAPPECMRELDDYPANWTCWRPEHRDSEALQRSNARVGVAAIEKAADGEDQVHDLSASHWAVGHIREVFIRLLRAAGDAEQAVTEDVAHACGLDPERRWCWTGAALEFARITRALEVYPILDESDYSALEREDEIEELENCWPRPRVEHPWPNVYDVHHFVTEVHGEWRCDPVTIERGLLAAGARPDERLVESALRFRDVDQQKRGRWHVVLVAGKIVARRRSAASAQRVVDALVATLISKHITGALEL